jgi:hypothetical protein
MHQAELNKPYNLIALSTECNGVTLEYTLLDWYFQHLLLIYYLFAETTLAFCPLGYYFTLSLAVVACFLDLLVHAGTHLVHLQSIHAYLHYSSFSFTSATCLYIVSSLALAGFTATCSLVGHLHRRSVVRLL